MKRTFLIITVLIFVLCGCDYQDTESAYPTINKTELNLTVGQSERLIVSNADKVEWNSSDSNVVRVYYGAVTALSEGSAVITASTGEKIFECTVVVNKGETTAQTQPQITSSSQQSLNSSQSITLPQESENQSEQNSSEKTYSEKVEATKKAAFNLIKDSVNKKYDKKIAELKDSYDKLAKTNEDSIKELEDQLKTVEEDSGEAFLIKDAIKTIKITTADAKKVLDEAIASLEEERKEELQKTIDDFNKNNSTNFN